MSRVLFVIILLFVSTAHAGEPVVRAQLDTKGPVLVGQQVTLTVDLLVPNFFAGAPRWPSLDFPGAVVTLSEGAEMNINDTIGGESYAGIRQTYRIIPQREGELALPAARITFRYAAEPGKPPVEASVALPALKLAVKLPPGAKSAAGAIPVAKVTATQTLDRDPQGMKVGDALTRTVEVYAERTRAMMIPPPAFDAPSGVRVYARDPVLNDVTKDRVGFVGGQRVDRATYVFEQPGDYTLPAIEIAWFDAAANRKETAVAPAIKVSIASNPGAHPEIAPEAPVTEASGSTRSRPWMRWLPWLAGLAVGTFALGWLARRSAPRIRGWGEARRRALAESEAAYGSRVLRACAANDAPAAYRSIMAWAKRAGSGAGRDRETEAVLTGEVAKLESSLFSGRELATSWNGRGLSSSFAAMLKARRSGRAATTSRQKALPALNPWSNGERGD